MVSDGHEVFVVADGVRIARRSRRGTLQAKTWVSLEPGWSVLDVGGGRGIEISGIEVPRVSVRAKLRTSPERDPPTIALASSPSA
jgi:hypothetical protein